MTDREIMQQALEALEQPTCNCNMRTRLVGDGREVCNPERAKELAEPEQEPVAWVGLLREARDNCKASIAEEGISASRKEYRIDLEARLTAALNTAPPQRKPLTEEEIEALDLPTSGTATVRDLVRLIERAHDIGEKE